MKLRFVLGVALVAVVAVGLLAQDKTSDSDVQKLQVELAEARLKMAETDLNLSLDENKRVPGVVAEITIARMQIGVAHAQARLARAKGKPNEFSLDVLKPAAELQIELLSTRLKRLTTAAQMTDDPIILNTLKRTQAQLAVAQIELKAIGAMEGRPAMEQLQWQIDQLGTQLDSINSRVTVLEDKR